MRTREQINEYHKMYQRERYKDPEFRKNLIIQMRVINNRATDKNKNIIYNELGGFFCSCKGLDCFHIGKCDITDKRCLQLDHINGDGAKRRKITGAGSMTYRFYAKNKHLIKKELQVLCANCNWVKRQKDKIGRPRKH